MRGDVGEGRSVDLSTTVAVVLVAGLPSLLLLAGVVPVAEALDVAPGLVEYTAFILVWNLAVLGLLVRLVPATTGTAFGHQIRRWWRLRHDSEVVDHPVLLWVAIVAVGVLGLSSVRLVLIDAAWDLLPGPEWSINSPDANRGAPGIEIGVWVLLFQLLVRIPLTVFVEETLFRGWVQDRHGVVVASLLFAGYHLAQWWTIPGLVPFAFALGLLRLATRSIWPGAVLHAAGNVVYAISLA